MAEDTGTQAKFEVIEYEGKPARQYPDGTIRGEHGHVLKLSSERAFEIRKMRQEQGVDIARETVRKVTGSRTFEEGYAKLVSKMVEAVMTETGRSRNDAMRWVALATQAYQVNVPQEKPHQTIQNQQNNTFMSPEYMEAVRKLSEVIEAE